MKNHIRTPRKASKRPTGQPGAEPSKLDLELAGVLSDDPVETDLAGMLSDDPVETDLAATDETTQV